MKLRTQVLLVGLATLAVPVLGWQGVRQLHVALQQSRIDAQTLAVASLRVALADEASLEGPLELGTAGPQEGDWYAESSRWPLFVDGYADDWQELIGETLRYGAGTRRGGGVSTDATLALRVARRADRLCLFVRVRDAHVVHHVPPRLPVDAGENERPDPQLLRANGDAVELYVHPPGAPATHALFSVIAPGTVEAERAAPPDAAESDARTERLTGGRRAPPSGEGALRRWRAEWVDDADGYQLEIELPLPPPGSRVGIAAIDVSRNGGARDAWVGSMSPEAMRRGAAGEVAGATAGTATDVAEGGRLRYESLAARAALRPWVTPGTRARLYDAQGWLIADVDALYAPSAEAASEEASEASLGSGLVDAILFRLFAWLAAGDLPLFPESEKTRQPLHLDAARRELARAGAFSTSRYVTVDNDRVLGTLVPVGAGAAGSLLFESNEEHASIATGSTLARLFALLLLTSLAVAALLFAWTTRLSLRIRRLSREASRAVDADGRVTALASSGARDEIGDLARDLTGLLARSAAYTRYLETLSGRLSHELGTPLSVVRTSLENLDRSRLDAESATLVARADGGAERLGGIVRALIDSTRLEQSVQGASFAPLALDAWVSEAAAEYAQVYPEHRFVASGAIDLLRGDGDVPPPAPVRLDASAPLLRQALDKLVANACDFATSPDIALVLAARGHGAGADVTIAVANRGPSIGAADRASVFEPSFSRRERAPEAAPPAPPGGAPGSGPHTGLGLHLVRLIAAAHGGEPLAIDRPDGVVIGMRLPLARRISDGAARVGPNGTRV